MYHLGVVIKSVFLKPYDALFSPAVSLPTNKKNPQNLKQTQKKNSTNHLFHANFIISQNSFFYNLIPKYATAPS